jgi:hypothetical protein
MRIINKGKPAEAVYKRQLLNGGFDLLTGRILPMKYIFGMKFKGHQFWDGIN